MKPQKNTTRIPIFEKKRRMSTKEKLHNIIFKSDTPRGKAFDIALLILITISIAAVLIESIPTIKASTLEIIIPAERVIGYLFIIEYIIRLYVSPIAKKYALSFYGIIDLIAILPTLIAPLYDNSHSLLVLRSLRLLRVFRVLQLTPYMKEASIIYLALKSSIRKILVFLAAIIIIVIIMGTLMYLVEVNAGSGFNSIPKSIYWAIVTLTTVGYGDIAPVTALGQFISSVLMILGYAIIAVPTGIVSAEIARPSLKVCRHCQETNNSSDAVFCMKCGRKL